MSPARASFADLDGILFHARHLLFSFDNTICDLLAGTTAAPACDQLRQLITGQGISIPPDVGRITDPVGILGYIADHLSPDIAVHAEAELAQFEDSAATSALPVPYVDDAIHACRDSGRSATIVGRNGTQAINLYLSTHQLTDMISGIIARDVPDISTIGHARLIERATEQLKATPDTCALICTTVEAIRDTEPSGAYRIAYARTFEDRDALESAGASATIMSLADLSLRLRARPLPN